MVTAPASHAERTALSLVLAIIASSNTPLLLIAGASSCRDFQIDPASVPGNPLCALRQGEWDIRQLTSLLEGAVVSIGHAKRALATIAENV